MLERIEKNKPMRIRREPKIRKIPSVLPFMLILKPCMMMFNYKKL